MCCIYDVLLSSVLKLKLNRHKSWRSEKACQERGDLVCIPESHGEAYVLMISMLIVLYAASQAAVVTVLDRYQRVSSSHLGALSLHNAGLLSAA